MGKPVEGERVVALNNAEANHTRMKQFACDKSNSIRTTKYTLVTFLPMNLFEQFRRIANIYFLFQTILQFIPAIAALSPITTLLPLLFVIGVSAIKDFMDDWKRRNSDKEVNNRPSIVWRGGEWTSITWKEIVVGDIVKVKKDDFLAADVVILGTSEPDRDCYIETADLDGETNLKKHYGLKSSVAVMEDINLNALQGTVTCDTPSNDLERFSGKLVVDGHDAEPLKPSNAIYRGCRLRNTAEVRGLVVYTGKDTKLMRNSGKIRFKRTHIDKQLNGLVLSIFLVLFFMCVTLAILSGWWSSTQGNAFRAFINQEEDANFVLIGVYKFFSYLIVLSNLVPISLYVSVELIRLVQSKLIGWDNKMSFKPGPGIDNVPAQARTTTLNEELGQIDYIFSDKTGTLTQNVMKFVQCSINGKIYGTPINTNEASTGAGDTFICSEMRQALLDKDKPLIAFLRLLGICHTVRPEPLADGAFDYQAQSPDEKALVEAAAEAGYVFTKRTNDYVEVKNLIEDKDERHELLAVLEFNSTRKRMTIILRDSETNRVVAYCKGADSILMPLLSQQSRDAQWTTTEEHLQEFAKDGLRTLVVAQKELEESFWNDWSARFSQAQIRNDADELAALAAEIESDLDLVGASAIDDKLQHRVPETIANLLRANIKLWVLTGDKQETAINIGYSCRLLTPSDTLLIVNGSNQQEVEEQLNEAKWKLESDEPPFAFVITGTSLTHSLPPTEKEKKFNPDYWTKAALARQTKLEDLLVEVSSQCKSVICCRVSPLQKAQVVALIKRHKGAITLAIGDGANDVSMIKEAHIGVGISGLEGRQAVLASDYAISQFEYLERLLLVHGHWSYVRMSNFLAWFFYKNFAYGWVEFAFAHFCGYSALTMYDPVFVSTFNVIFTSIPVLLTGTLEQDVTASACVKYPTVYEAGPRNILFSYKKFYFTLFKGLVHGLLVFFTALFGIEDGGAHDSLGQTRGDYQSIAAITSLCLVWVVSIELGMITRFWTWMNFIALFIGPIAWFLVFSVLYRWDDWLFVYQSIFFGTFNHSIESQNFWGTFFLVIATCGVLTLIEHYVTVLLWPNPIDYIREKIYFDKLPPREPLTEIERPIEAGKTSYAFSQQDGAGSELMQHKS
eukprot:m.47587 g.47587  ORF g.47587 m.47587 type:complete len:1130 (-) comp10986_c0_seq5:1786-5175(-)